MYLSTVRAEIESYRPPDKLCGTVDYVVTSPPYKDKDGYSNDMIQRVGAIMNMVLKPGGLAFVNFGQLKEDFGRPQHVQRLIGYSLCVGQTIIWVKSIAMDNKQRGHYQPINSKRLLNYCWEYIFVFYKKTYPDLDRLALGVPYADKSNLERGNRGKNGDLHCSGDVWFVPYKTTGQSKKKKHKYEFPADLVRRCLRLAGAKKGDTVLDPFCGSGTTAAVAAEFGMNAIVIDRDQSCLDGATSRWEKTIESLGDPCEAVRS